jgi:hypothetical protein
MNPELKYLRIKIADLVLDPANARKHSKKNLAAIKGSLAKFGQQKPIVIDANQVVIAGNGTVLAATELGWTEIDAVQTELTGAEAIAFAITDNRTGELAEWDWEPLGAQLAGLLDESWDLGNLGWEEWELKPLLSAEWTPPDKEDNYDPENDNPSSHQVTVPHEVWILLQDVKDDFQVEREIEAISAVVRHYLAARANGEVETQE